MSEPTALPAQIVELREAVLMADKYHRNGEPIVFTNGCFDLLHRGHVELLTRASSYGKLFVGINDDAAVRSLKGPTRPVNQEADRAFVVAELRCVAVVVIIRDANMAEALRRLAPDHWAKGGDYTLDTLNKEEVLAAHEAGTEIVLLPHLTDVSSTKLMERMTA